MDEQTKTKKTTEELIKDRLESKKQSISQNDSSKESLSNNDQDSNAKKLSETITELNNSGVYRYNLLKIMQENQVILIEFGNNLLSKLDDISQKLKNINKN